MIRFIGQLPNKCVVAFSGGVDSVVVTDFLLNGKKDVSLAFFHHGTPTSEDAEPFVRSFAEERGLSLTVGRIDPTPAPPRVSLEEHWRDCRYEFLSQFTDPVITCHHLDDAVETWIFTSLHGEGRLIPYRRCNVVRPFLLTEKSQLISWAQSRGLKWSEDPTNRDVKHPRNLIRHALMPHALKVNPGLYKVIKKKYLSKYSATP